jgi:hypothetical protein
VGEEKRRKKNDKEKEKYASDLREELKTPSTRQYKWIILIYSFILFFHAGTDVVRLKGGGVS